ncbi:MAG: MBL fold metallo-hydrolase [bacterium]
MLQKDHKLLVIWFFLFGVVVIAGFYGCGKQLSVPDNAPPVVSTIPGQIILPYESFQPINLDLYVEDDAADSAIVWSVSGLVNLSVVIENRIAEISPTDPNWRGSEVLTFTATDPQGLSSSISAILGVVDPQEGEIQEADGRIRIAWQTFEESDSRVLYWQHPTGRAHLASTRNEFGMTHSVRLLELEEERQYDYFAFCLDAFGDTIYHSPQDSFITSNVQSAAFLKAHFIDVGQGDGCLIQTAGGFNLMVDGGYGSNSSEPWQGGGIPLALNYLQNLGITQIDLMIKTHNHADHYGGLSDISYSGIPVLEKQAPFEDYGYSNSFTPGDVRALDGSTSMKVLNSGYPPGVSQSGENNSSMVLRITYGDLSILMTGDAENVVNSYLVTNVASDLPSTVLKVNHHGSSDATSDIWLNTVSPTYAIISCGTGNPYGHPHGSTLSKLASRTIEILRTDLNGDIVMIADDDQSWVWIYNP